MPRRSIWSSFVWLLLRLRSALAAGFAWFLSHEAGCDRSEAQEAVLRAAGLATLVAAPQATMPVSAMVAQIRATATDLLEALGPDHETAVTNVRHSAGELTQDGVSTSSRV